jgi:hypothetical protein
VNTGRQRYLIRAWSASAACQTICRRKDLPDDSPERAKKRGSLPEEKKMYQDIPKGKEEMNIRASAFCFHRLSQNICIRGHVVRNYAGISAGDHSLGAFFYDPVKQELVPAGSHQNHIADAQLGIARSDQNGIPVQDERGHTSSACDEDKRRPARIKLPDQIAENPLRVNRHVLL